MQPPLFSYCCDKWDRDMRDKEWEKYKEDFNQYRKDMIEYVKKVKDPDEPKVYDGDEDHYMLRHVHGVPQNPMTDPYYTESLKPESEGMKKYVALYEIAIAEYEAWKEADNKKLIKEWQKDMEINPDHKSKNAESSTK